MRRVLPAALVILIASGLAAWYESAPAAGEVVLSRTPNAGLQPEAVVDRSGTVHLVYLSGEPRAADVFYARSADGGRHFTPAIRVNSEAGSAIAMGTIRGAQIAVGPSGRIHVAWNGADRAVPAGSDDKAAAASASPMLYARSNPDGTAFEPQRNLMTRTMNLDGGGSVAADAGGRVYVAWHAHAAGEGAPGEDARRLWIARSEDDGATFGAEAPIAGAAPGVCACCAVRLFAVPDGRLALLYRSAVDKVHRDVRALVSADRGATFRGTLLDEWAVGACPMTSMSAAAGPRLMGAWESEGEVYLGPLDGSTPPVPPSEAAVDAPVRKHPRLAVDRRRTMLLVWTEGTAWGHGGSIAWRAFTPDGKPAGAEGRQDGLPAWSFAAAIPRKDGGFTVLY